MLEGGLMPTIAQAQNADLSGYAPVSNLPVTYEMVNNNKPRANPAIRCPLPPFNLDPDTLRQFETGNSAPQIRVMPVPMQTGNSTTILNGGGFIGNAGTSATGSGSGSGGSGSGGSGGSGSSLTLKSVVLTTGSIAVGGSFLGSVSMAKSFQLISLTTSQPCDIILYGTNAIQAFDATRAVDAPVPAEISDNIICDVIFDTTPFTWGCQNLCGANQDTPQSTNVYVTVKNTGNATLSPVQVTITYVGLES
jgi:hypothetical protein